MSQLAPFPAVFHALWGYDPFPWQSILAERAADGGWPAALDLPTASGKTACIEIALFALAAQADRPTAERTAPRRIWFVVDRRIVVDEAYARAERIAEKLRAARSGPLRELAERLREVAGTDRPLAVARLRGGVLRDDGWARVPSQPAVITSTVDQLGSRLLFRGYGRSLLAAPIFAGLAANDSLILLDEAHCSVPFFQTLHAVETFRGEEWAEAAVPAPFAFVVLSATPPDGVAEAEIFPGADRDEALDHPVLQRRLQSSKPTTLVEVKKQRGASSDPLVGEAVERVEAYLEAEKRRISVMVNRVRTAREIAADLADAVAERADVVLLTGRLRPFERDRLVAGWSPYLRASSPEKPPRPIVLVSTQCLEVGADFSFDALVTECASLDALRQRFGRVNRMGESETAPATILIRDRDTDPAKAEPDPIYGTALAGTWELLRAKATNDSIDFGFERLRAAFEGIEDLSPYLAPASDAPVLLPAHLDLFCQTAPPARPEPDVQLFLHGKDRGALEVQVVWRADLPAENTQDWVETVALCPPVSGEMLSVSLYQARSFLAQRDTAVDSGDVEGVPEASGNQPQRSRPFLLWRGRGRGRSVVTTNPREIDPGDIVVLPATYGIEPLGQPPVAAGIGTVGLDLWERVRETAGKPAAIRLTRAVLTPWLDCPPVDELLRVAEERDDDRLQIDEAIDAVLEYEPGDEEEASAPPKWWRNLLRTARTGRREEHPVGGIVLFGRAPAQGRPIAEQDLFADDDDLTSASGKEVPLDHHSGLVERTALRIAKLCLPEEYSDLLQLAARWHDTGKLDERFQIVLRGGDELAAVVAATPLAKSSSIPTSPVRRAQIRDAAKLPDAFRHEMLSVQLAAAFAPLPSDEESADLILHLIGSHHGYGRPFAPVSLDDAPLTVTGERAGVTFALSAEERTALPPPHRLDSGIADRFWHLVRRHGWWGLAYLEAVLRLSDWYASERALQENDTGQRESAA